MDQKFLYAQDGVLPKQKAMDSPIKPGNDSPGISEGFVIPTKAGSQVFGCVAFEQHAEES